MNFKKIIFVVGIAVFLIISYIFFEMLSYRNYIATCRKEMLNYGKSSVVKSSGYSQSCCENDGYESISSALSENPNSCYCKMFSLLLPRLLVYKVKVNNKNLEFIRPTLKSFYILPTVALEKADEILGYGVLSDIKFEQNVAKLYKKPIHTYDCGVIDFDTESPLISFESECIGTDKFLLKEYDQVSSGKIHTFGQKLKQLHLESKKVFVKMDIAGAEIDVIPDLVKYSDNITAISIVIRFDDVQKLIKMNELLSLFEKDFVLVNRNLVNYEILSNCKCKYMDSNFSEPFALTYINKKMISSKYLPFKQDYSDTKNYFSPIDMYTYIPHYTIDWRIVMYEKIKKTFSFNRKQTVDFVDKK